MIEAVLFDWHGVICNKPYLEWVHLHHPDAAMMKRLIGLADQVDAGKITLEQFYAYVGAQVEVSPEDVAQGIANRVLIDSDVTEVIRDLRAKKLYVCIASNVSGKFLRDTLDAHGLTGCFDQIVASSDVLATKPSEMFFDAALKASRRPGHPEQCAFVDDTVDNVVAADRFGLRAFLFESAASLRVSLDLAKIL